MRARIDIPIIVNHLFLHEVQISLSRPCYVHLFQWNTECSFLRHMELNSKFIVMTLDEVTLDRLEVGTGFSVICCFCRLRLSRFALKFLTENLAPLEWVSRNSWSLPYNFAVPSANGQINSSPFCLIIVSLALIRRG